MNDSPAFSIGGAVSAGWNIFKTRYGEIYKLFGLYFLVIIGLYFVQGLFGWSSEYIGEGIALMLGLLLAIAINVYQFMLNINVSVVG